MCSKKWILEHSNEQAKRGNACLFGRVQPEEGCTLPSQEGREGNVDGYRNKHL